MATFLFLTIDDRCWTCSALITYSLCMTLELTWSQLRIPNGNLVSFYFKAKKIVKFCSIVDVNWFLFLMIGSQCSGRGVRNMRIFKNTFLTFLMIFCCSNVLWTNCPVSLYTWLYVKRLKNFFFFFIFFYGLMNGSTCQVNRQQTNIVQRLEAMLAK